MLVLLKFLTWKKFRCIGDIKKIFTNEYTLAYFVKKKDRCIYRITAAKGTQTVDIIPM